MRGIYKGTVVLRIQWETLRVWFDFADLWEVESSVSSTTDVITEGEVQGANLWQLRGEALTWQYTLKPEQYKSADGWGVSSLSAPISSFSQLCLPCDLWFDVTVWSDVGPWAVGDLGWKRALGLVPVNWATSITRCCALLALLDIVRILFTRWPWHKDRLGKCPRQIGLCSGTGWLFVARMMTWNLHILPMQGCFCWAILI